MMKFEDYKDDYSKLVGKTVLHRYGKSYDRILSRSISTITKVTKTGFRIEDRTNMLFDFSGNQKGLGGRTNMGTVSNCKLITENEDKWLLAEFALNKYKMTMIKVIKEYLVDKEMRHLIRISLTSIHKIYRVVKKELDRE